MNIKQTNGKLIKEILDKVGPHDSVIKTQSDWAFSIYYSERDESSITIEMCLNTDYGGDPLFDPLMRIELSLDAEGNITEAKPLYYLSRTLFFCEEIYSEDNPSCYDPKLYEKAGELDSRLAEWLEMLRIQGYLTDGVITGI